MIRDFSTFLFADYTEVACPRFDHGVGNPAGEYIDCQDTATPILLAVHVKTLTTHPAIPYHEAHWGREFRHLSPARSMYTR